MRDLIRWISRRAVFVLVILGCAGMPATALAGPWVQVTNMTRGGNFVYQTGDTIYVHIWGADPNSYVYWSDPPMGPGWYYGGMTNLYGQFGLYATPSEVDIGPWQQSWRVGLFTMAIPDPIYFWVTSYQDPAVVPAYGWYPWNTYAEIQLNNNCYNYGANTITNDYAQPGYWGTGTLCGDFPPPLSCINADEFYLRVLADGFSEASAAGYGGYDAVCPSGTAKMALMIWPQYDFHFYRQDSTGWWSHKQGQQLTRYWDFSGHEIYNPLNADTYPYWVFGGFFCVPHSSNAQGFSAATIAGIGAPQ